MEAFNWVELIQCVRFFILNSDSILTLLLFLQSETPDVVIKQKLNSLALTNELSKMLLERAGNLRDER